MNEFYYEIYRPEEKVISLAHKKIENSYKITQAISSSEDFDAPWIFDASSNLLTEFKTSWIQFLPLDKLITIIIAANHLKSFTIDHGNCLLLSLRELHLNYNSIDNVTIQIQNVHGSFTEFLPNLKVLNLSHNRLNDMKKVKILLDHHQKLLSLSLSFNNISSLDSYSLPLIPNLRVFSLFANNLNSKKPDCSSKKKFIEFLFTLIKSHFPKLSELYISGNPLFYDFPFSETIDMVKNIIPSLKYLDGIKISTENLDI